MSKSKPKSNSEPPKSRKKEKLTPAIPPEDYKGSVAHWMTQLQERGLWNGYGFYGDVMIPTDAWWEILEECEL